MEDTLQITPKESVRVLSSDDDALVVEVLYSAEGEPPPKHLHPAQDEHFEVLEGTIDVWVDGQKREVGEGETIEIPRGSAHQMWNGGFRDARVRWRTEPGGRTEQWFRAIDRLYREDRVGRNGEPNALAFAALLTEYDDVFRLAVGPPALVQGALRVLAPFGRARGYLPE